jgi:Zn-finger nucleic acid-binding protein
LCEAGINAKLDTDYFNIDCVLTWVYINGKFCSGTINKVNFNMRCPSCKGSELIPSFLDDLFRSHTCKDCGGSWLLIEDYVAWKERNPEYAFSQDALFDMQDSKNALLCPVTGTIMQKYRISHDSDHHLDYSASVGGVWLDSGEWEYLKKHKLAGSLNRLFTSHWQKSIRENTARITLSDMYRAKFGEETYLKAKEIREWLNNHPRKADLRSYILAEDPYSTEK